MPWEHEYGTEEVSEYACGMTVGAPHGDAPCTKDPKFPRFDDYVLNAGIDGKYGAAMRVLRKHFHQQASFGLIPPTVRRKTKQVKQCASDMPIEPSSGQFSFMPAQLRITGRIAHPHVSGEVNSSILEFGECCGQL